MGSADQLYLFHAVRAIKQQKIVKPGSHIHAVHTACRPPRTLKRASSKFTLVRVANVAASEQLHASAASVQTLCWLAGWLYTRLLHSVITGPEVAHESAGMMHTN